MSEDMEQLIENEIVPLIYEGKKIQAIKAYRALTRKGLKESKQEVEGLSQRLYRQHPEKFRVAPSASRGCAAVILLSTSLALLAIRLLG